MDRPSMRGEPDLNRHSVAVVAGRKSTDDQDDGHRQGRAQVDCPIAPDLMNWATAARAGTVAAAPPPVDRMRSAVVALAAVAMFAD